MSECCNECGETWRLLAIGVRPDEQIRLNIPGKLFIVGTSVQLAVVPIARVAFPIGRHLRRFRLSVSLARPDEAMKLINEAPAAEDLPNRDHFSLVVKAPDVRFEALERVSASPRPAFVDQIDVLVSLLFDGQRAVETSEVMGYLRVDEEVELTADCPSVCHAHWEGWRFYGARTRCHAPDGCESGKLKWCVCEGPRNCDGWQYCECV
jgi:hypothetical protein